MASTAPKPLSKSERSARVQRAVESHGDEVEAPTVVIRSLRRRADGNQACPSEAEKTEIDVYS